MDVAKAQVTAVTATEQVVVAAVAAAQATAVTAAEQVKVAAVATGTAMSRAPDAAIRPSAAAGASSIKEVQVDKIIVQLPNGKFVVPQPSQLVQLRLAVDTVASQYQALGEEDEDVGYKYVRDAGLQTYESYGCPVIDDYSDALAVLTSSYHPVVITEQRFPRDIFGEVLGSLCGQCETWFKPLVYVGGATAPCPVCYIQSALEDDLTSSKVLPLKKTRNNGAPAAGCGGSSVADKNHDTGMSITPGAATRSTAAEHAKKKEEEEKLKAVSERRRLEEEERKVDEVDFEPLPARVIVPLSPVQTKVMQSLFPDATNATETLQDDPSETTNTTSRRSNRIAVIEDAVHRAIQRRSEGNQRVCQLSGEYHLT